MYSHKDRAVLRWDHRPKREGSKVVSETNTAEIPQVGTFPSHIRHRLLRVLYGGRVPSSVRPHCGREVITVNLLCNVPLKIAGHGHKRVANAVFPVSSIKNCLTKAEQRKEQAVTVHTKMKACKLYPATLQSSLIYFGGQWHLLRHQI